MKIKVKHKKHYGRENFYADCPLSKLLCELQEEEVICLKPWQLQLLRNAGWEIEVVENE